MNTNQCDLGARNSDGSRELRGIFGQTVGSIDLFGKIRDNLGAEVGRLGFDVRTEKFNRIEPFALSGPAATHLNIPH